MVAWVAGCVFGAGMPQLAALSGNAKSYAERNFNGESPISLEDIRDAASNAITRLDGSFFRIRLDRLTPQEWEYVIAMAMLVY